VTSLGSENVELHFLTGLSALNVDDPAVDFEGSVAGWKKRNSRVHPHSVDDARSSPNGGNAKHLRMNQARFVLVIHDISAFGPQCAGAGSRARTRRRIMFGRVVTCAGD